MLNPQCGEVKHDGILNVFACNKLHEVFFKEFKDDNNFLGKAIFLIQKIRTNIQTGRHTNTNRHREVKISKNTRKIMLIKNNKKSEVFLRGTGKKFLDKY